VIFGTQKLTYGELNARSNQLAHYLQQYRITPNTPIGLCVRPSVENGGLACWQFSRRAELNVPLDAISERAPCFHVAGPKTPVVLKQQH